MDQRQSPMSKYSFKRSENTDDWEHIWKATHCSMGFFLLYASTNTVGSVQSQIFTNNGYEMMGYLELGLSYGFIAVGCFFAPLILSIIGVKSCLVIGALCDMTWVFAQMIPAYNAHLYQLGQPELYSKAQIVAANTFAAILSGIGTSLIWVAGGKYISDCATEGTKGFYFSYFWTYYMASQVAGNLFASFVFKKYDLMTFYSSMALLAFIAASFFMFLKMPSSSGDASQFDNTEQSILQEQILDAVTEEVDQSEQTEQINLTKWQAVKDHVQTVFQFMISNHMRFLLPSMFWTGISLSIYTGSLVPMITSTLPDDDTNIQISKGLLSMMFLGAGEIFGSLIMGQIIDRRGNIAAGLVCMVLIFTQTVMALLFLYINQYGVMAFILPFFWGVQDGSFNTHIQEVKYSQSNKWTFQQYYLVLSSMTMCNHMLYLISASLLQQ